MLKIRNDRQLRSLTGISEEVLAKIGPMFAKTYRDQKAAEYEKAKAAGKRQRKMGGGRKGKLSSMRAKLHYILYYLKNYPTFDVLAEKVDLSISTAHGHVKALLPIITKALKALGYLPAREFASAEELKEACEDIDSLLIDATEREHFRPKDAIEQKEHYSGKQGYHTVKNTVISTSFKRIIYLGKTFGGRHHDYGMFKTEFPPETAWFEALQLYADSGYQGMKTDYPQSNAELPFKKPKKSKNNPNPQLSDEQKAHNKAVSQARIFVENAIGGIKRFYILVNRFRNRLENFVDDVIAVCAGLWNAMLS